VPILEGDNKENNKRDAPEFVHSGGAMSHRR
jgi:hypothetical protein